MLLSPCVLMLSFCVMKEALRLFYCRHGPLFIFDGPQQARRRIFSLRITTRSTPSHASNCFPDISFDDAIVRFAPPRDCLIDIYFPASMIIGAPMGHRLRRHVSAPQPSRAMLHFMSIYHQFTGRHRRRRRRHAACSYAFDIAGLNECRLYITPLVAQYKSALLGRYTKICRTPPAKYRR